MTAGHLHSWVVAKLSPALHEPSPFPWQRQRANNLSCVRIRMISPFHNLPLCLRLSLQTVSRSSVPSPHDASWTFTRVLRAPAHLSTFLEGWDLPLCARELNEPHYLTQTWLNKTFSLVKATFHPVSQCTSLLFSCIPVETLTLALPGCLIISISDYQEKN